jgi:hypothetical protein
MMRDQGEEQVYRGVTKKGQVQQCPLIFRY